MEHFGSKYSLNVEAMGSDKFISLIDSNLFIR